MRAISATIAIALCLVALAVGTHREPDFVDILFDSARNNRAEMSQANPGIRSGWSWTTCGEGAVTIDEIMTIPERPEGGKNITVIGAGSTTTTIDVCNY